MLPESSSHIGMSASEVEGMGLFKFPLFRNVLVFASVIIGLSSL